MFLSLGEMALVNSFVSKRNLDQSEPKFPLDVYFCKNCYLVQLVDVVPPEVMFSKYVYFTDTSETMKIHFSELATETIELLALSKESLVVDIGGNDGTLLKNFRKQGIITLNVEPAKDQAKIAESQGIDTINEFWNDDLAQMILKKKGKAKLIMMTNVFAHVDRLQELIGGIQILLEDGGVFLIEVPYLVDMIEKKEFDTIYHEHLSYFSLRPLITFFAKHNMEIFRAKRIGVHGGSIRVYARKATAPLQIHESVERLMELEKAKNLDRMETFFKFASDVTEIKKRLRKLLLTLKNQKKRIIGYTAPAKGNVLLNYCNIGTEILDYLTDVTPAKQGLYSPGMQIPVHPPEILEKDHPDYLLMLAWNYKEEILRKEQDYIKKGGKFIIPIPEPRIIE
jgi:hypothetical protein